jgi:hypothetical protein
MTRLQAPALNCPMLAQVVSVHAVTCMDWLGTGLASCQLDRFALSACRSASARRYKREKKREGLAFFLRF